MRVYKFIRLCGDKELKQAEYRYSDHLTSAELHDDDCWQDLKDKICDQLDILREELIENEEYRNEIL